MHSFGINIDSSFKLCVIVDLIECTLNYFISGINVCTTLKTRKYFFNGHIDQIMVMFYQSIDEQFQIKKRFNSIGSKKRFEFQMHETNQCACT